MRCKSENHGAVLRIDRQHKGCGVRTHHQNSLTRIQQQLRWLSMPQNHRVLLLVLLVSLNPFSIPRALNFEKLNEQSNEGACKRVGFPDATLQWMRRRTLLHADIPTVSRPKTTAFLLLAARIGYLRTTQTLWSNIANVAKLLLESRKWLRCQDVLTRSCNRGKS